ncbi:hypothetical protein EC973_008175 [Apophysomyces ossiformis]|uniref:BZIP domain-containing protein n=1 Tax=Apophysomyces ossiformis TaxID=679940 RepID=A0A8H7EQG6_9FUNG|nr:hypothetical protein EC973_008175 [Apophysomyces ossiformis]
MTEAELEPSPSVSPHVAQSAPFHSRISNSPPMAVLPLNSSSKLEQEPNPFEESFSGATAASANDAKEKRNSPSETTNKPILPPVASITSPAIPLIGTGILPKDVESQFTWDSLRAGPLSPSMLQGPANPAEFHKYAFVNAKIAQQTINSSLVNQPSLKSTSDASTVQYNAPNVFVPHQPTVKAEIEQQNPDIYMQVNQRQQSPSKLASEESNAANRRNTSRKSTYDEDAKESSISNKKKKTTKDKAPEDDEKRKNFLERNRIAALKCRQRKKQWLNNLQSKVEFLTNDNERLQMQAEALREEIVNLKTLLMAHKDCPIAQANGFHPATIQKPIAPMTMRPVAPGPVAPVNNLGQAMYPQAFATASGGVMTSSPMTNSVSNTAAPTIPTSSPSSSSSHQFHHNTMVGMPPPVHQAQHGMVAGGNGSTSVLRF